MWLLIPAWYTCFWQQSPHILHHPLLNSKCIDVCVHITLYYACASYETQQAMGRHIPGTPSYIAPWPSGLTFVWEYQPLVMTRNGKAVSVVTVGCICSLCESWNQNEIVCSSHMVESPMWQSSLVVLFWLGDSLVVLVMVHTSRHVKHMYNAFDVVLWAGFMTLEAHEGSFSIWNMRCQWLKLCGDIRLPWWYNSVWRCWCMAMTSCERHCVSIHPQLYCLFNSLFRITEDKTPRLALHY